MEETAQDHQACLSSKGRKEPSSLDLIYGIFSIFIPQESPSFYSDTYLQTGTHKLSHTRTHLRQAIKYRIGLLLFF